MSGLLSRRESALSWALATASLQAAASAPGWRASALPSSASTRSDAASRPHVQHPLQLVSAVLTPLDVEVEHARRAGRGYAHAEH